MTQSETSPAPVPNPAPTPRKERWLVAQRVLLARAPVEETPTPAAITEAPSGGESESKSTSANQQAVPKPPPKPPTKKATAKSKPKPKKLTAKPTLKAKAKAQTKAKAKTAPKGKEKPATQSKLARGKSHSTLEEAQSWQAGPYAANTSVAQERRKRLISSLERKTPAAFKARFVGRGIVSEEEWRRVRETWVGPYSPQDPKAFQSAIALLYANALSQDESYDALYRRLTSYGLRPPEIEPKVFNQLTANEHYARVAVPLLLAEGNGVSPEYLEAQMPAILQHGLEQPEHKQETGGAS